MNNLKELLNTLNGVTALLLNAEGEKNIKDAIYLSMDMIGRRVDADRVQIWKNEAIEGVLHLSINWNG